MQGSIQSRIHLTATTTMILFEIVREIAELANPELFDKHGTDCLAQFIHTHANERLDKIIQATVGFGTPVRVRPATAGSGNDVEEGVANNGRSPKTPTRKRNFRNNLKVLSCQLWSNNRDQLSSSSTLCDLSPRK